MFRVSIHSFDHLRVDYKVYNNPVFNTTFFNKVMYGASLVLLVFYACCRLESCYNV